MLESERQLIILAHGLAGCVELLLLLRGEVQLNDLCDAVATHDSGHAGVHIVLTVFAVQQNRNRKNTVLVVKDGANDLCGRSADAELGALLAAQDGPAAFTACVSKRIQVEFAEGVRILLAPLGKRLARDGDSRPCDHLAFAVLAPARSRGAVLRNPT